jgi:uncharacterized protein (UPF0276 family)
VSLADPPAGGRGVAPQSGGAGVRLPAGEIGVGLVYGSALAPVLAPTAGLVDTVSLIPETLWHESAGTPRYSWIPGAVRLFDAAVGLTPTVFHGVGLSIASGLALDLEHLDQIAEAADRYRPLWYSEHLSAFRVSDGAGGSAHAGVGLPVPFDANTLEFLIPKVAGTMARLGVPVLLENSAIYVDVPGAELTEPQFLNRLCGATGAGVLLDLHNLFVNEVNLGWQAEQYLAELDLGLVTEIHVAGGELMGRWYTDAHSGRCPDRVWQLLDLVVAAAPKLELITFEMHESRVAQIGLSGVIEQLLRIRAAIPVGASPVS